MDEAIDILCRLLTAEKRRAAFQADNRDLTSQSASLRRLSPPRDYAQELWNLLNAPKANQPLHDLGASTEAQKLPCANVEVEKNRCCPNEGILTCGGCRLVSYCSKECQKTHWHIHKQDCKDNIRSDTWQPA
ncbi:hypothetical protein SCP_1203040 [Sparassis crispa]|uniref:MYND-type domain-containing protein n=1 Tax=Sparassis crispa TaxID=139825 RepID=A0A401H0X3_9APHY|nr:hypothetical protein SCP_1203040 [Sparassis crispa]GBE88075.1 hypothetical protein SCP_1203040 [Sparassis crispa]